MWHSDGIWAMLYICVGFVYDLFGIQYDSPLCCIWCGCECMVAGIIGFLLRFWGLSLVNILCSMGVV